jgi:hypothetical protein
VANAVTQTILTGPVCFLRTISHKIRETADAVKVKAVLVSRGQYIFLFTEPRAHTSAPEEVYHLENVINITTSEEKQ